MKKTLIALLAVMLVAVACCAVASAYTLETKYCSCEAKLLATVTVEPTCCTPGQVTYHCPVSTEHPSGTDLAAIPATGNHDYTVKVKSSEKEAKNCGDFGEVTYRCKTDGCTATKVLPLLSEPKPHNLDKKTEYTPATCTEQAVYLYECSNGDCHYHEFHSEGKLADHTPEEVVLQEASCKAGTGKIWYNKCKVCGAKIDNSLKSGKVPEHKWQFKNPVEWTKRTCTTAGVSYNKCSVCGTIEQKTLDPLGHQAPDDASKITIKTKATCLTKGVRTYKCVRCEKTVDETLGYGDHNWVTTEVGIKKSIATRTCTVCNRSQYKDMYNGGWVTSVKGKSIADNMKLVDTPNCDGTDDKKADVPHKTTKTATKTAKASAASTKANASGVSIPKTNDNTSTLPFVMMGIALVGIVALIASKRKVNG